MYAHTKLKIKPIIHKDSRIIHINSKFQLIFSRWVHTTYMKGIENIMHTMVDSIALPTVYAKNLLNSILAFTKSQLNYM